MYAATAGDGHNEGSRQKEIWMRQGSLIASLLVVLLAGCAYWGNQERQSSFDKTSRAYEKAMEWSNYDALHGLVRMPEGSKPFDPSVYKNFKVTAYKARGGAGSIESGIVTRTAHISYVWLPRMSERSLTVQEVWEYSEKEKRWYLKNGLPEFR